MLFLDEQHLLAISRSESALGFNDQVCSVVEGKVNEVSPSLRGTGVVERERFVVRFDRDFFEFVADDSFESASILGFLSCGGSQRPSSEVWRIFRRRANVSSQALAASPYTLV
jgi:hypothetical protein